jgi:hypothetical protein
MSGAGAGKAGSLLLLALCIAAPVASGCASAATHRAEQAEAFGSLSALSRRAVLHSLPDLTDAQRKELLEGVAEYRPPRDLLAEFGLETRFFGEGGSEDPLPTTQGPERLEVQVQGELSSSEIPLSAVLIYPGGKKVDVTGFSSWSVLPGIAEIRLNKLVPGCASVDVGVSATFLGVMEGRANLALRKKVRTLELTLAPSSQTGPEGNTLLLEAVAHCQDGTQTAITCLAEWSAHSEDGEMAGCGRFKVSAPKSRKEGSAQFTVKYGEHQESRRIAFPLWYRGPR